MIRIYLSKVAVFGLILLGTMWGFAIQCWVITFTANSSSTVEKEHKELLEIVQAHANDLATNARRSLIRKKLQNDQENLHAMQSTTPKQIFICPAYTILTKFGPPGTIGNNLTVSYDVSSFSASKVIRFQSVKLTNNQAQCLYQTVQEEKQNTSIPSPNRPKPSQEKIFQLTYSTNNPIKSVGSHWRPIDAQQVVCDSLDVATCAFTVAETSQS